MTVYSIGSGKLEQAGDLHNRDAAGSDRDRSVAESVHLHSKFSGQQRLGIPVEPERRLTVEFAVVALGFESQSDGSCSSHA